MNESYELSVPELMAGSFTGPSDDHSDSACFLGPRPLCLSHGQFYCSFRTLVAVNWSKIAEMAPTQSQPWPLLAPLSLSSCHLDPFNSPFRPTDLHPLSQWFDGEQTMVASSSPLSSLCVLTAMLLGPVAHSAEMMGRSHASPVPCSA